MKKPDSITPSLNDLEERIRLNREKDGLTLEQIAQDTRNLIKEFEWTAARSNVQVRIYKDLLELVEAKMKAGV